MPATDSSDGLVCPSCGLTHEASERFCSRCGMLLVHSGADLEQPRSAAHARARRIDPAYTRGELIRVAGGRNQAEAELIQNLLLEEGIPSIVRRTAGFDVPDYLAGGPRDVLVAESAVQAAREMLLEADMAPQQRTADVERHPLRTALIVVGVVAVAVVIVFLLWLAVPSG